MDAATYLRHGTRYKRREHLGLVYWVALAIQPDSVRRGD